MTEGRCNCGGIKVSIPSLPEHLMICYCGNCRRAGSSIGSLVYYLDEKDFTIHDPGSNLKNYRDSDTKSGNPITRRFCGNCGSPVVSIVDDELPKVFLKAGLFDHLPPPGLKAFEHNEPSWMKVQKPGEQSS